MRWFGRIVATLCALGAAMPSAATEIVDVGWGFTAVYAVHEPATGAVILVDAQNPGKGDRIVRRLERHGLDPDAVRAIVLTHGHPDHAGSAAELAERLQVPIVAGAADRPYLAAGEAPFHPTGCTGRLVSAFVTRRFPPLTPDVAVEDTLDLAAYGVPGELRVVGGHTPGSVSLVLNGGADVIVGDLIRTRTTRRSVPALHFFHDDLPAAHAALATIAAEATGIWPIHRGRIPAERVTAWLAEHPERQVPAPAKAR